MFVWSSTLVTHIPFHEQYEFTDQQVSFLNNAFSQKKESQLFSLKLVSALITLSFMLTIHLVWRRKP